MADLEQAVQAIEQGLLTAVNIKGRPQEGMSLHERMTHFNVPGFSIALIDQEEVAWARGYGVLEAGGEEPVTDETIFQAGSISKPVSAMIALHLVEAGLLDLDADVNEAMRSWQVPENEHAQVHKVTLRGLLSHTAGLTVSGYRGYPSDAQLPTIQQILDGEPPANSDPVRVMQPPGTSFSYSGGGYVVVQQLIEDVTGRPFAALAQELIFDKLGMTNSTFESLLPEAYIPQAATAHRGSGEPVPGKWHTYPEQPPASLWSTPSDMARLTVEVLKSYENESNLVLSAEMTRQMLTPYVSNWVGLGFPILEKDGRIRFEHPGWNEGFHSLMAGYLDAGRGLVWMTNGENGKLLGHEVMRALDQVFGCPGYEPVEKSTTQVDAAVFTQNEGKYQDVDYPDYGVEIIQDGQALILRETPGGIHFQLYPESETDFFCLEHSEEITFIKNAQGNVEAMMIGESSYLERVE
jgi:CubicO group peptidase (beta-lactamase class C family)